MSTQHIGRLTSIMRYPLKGFPGENLDGAQLAKNCGLPKDRSWAIRNGVVDITPNGSGARARLLCA